MLFSWFEVLLLVGVIQGLVTSFLLFKEPAHKVQHRLLGLAIFSFAAICLKKAIYSLGLENTYSWLEFIPLAFETAIAPLIYLYCESLTESEFNLTTKKKLHFIPFLAFFVYAFIFYISVRIFASNETQEEVVNLFRFDFIKQLEDYFTVLSILVYLTFGAEILKRYRLEANNFTSDNDYIVFSWLRSIQILMSVLIVFLVINMVLDRISLDFTNTDTHWKVYFLFLAGVVYYFGIKAFKLPILLDRSREELLMESKSKQSKPDHKTLALAWKIENVIEEKKLYLNPTFSIRELSELVNVNQSTVSHTINQCLGTTFRDLINKKRIERSKELLLINKYSNISVLAQALECGFNSEASFYRVFKNHTGQSPTQFIKNAEK